MKCWKRRGPSEGLIKAQRERQEAERLLADVRAQTPYYRRLGASMVVIQQRNHLAESLGDLFTKAREGQ